MRWRGVLGAALIVGFSYASSFVQLRQSWRAVRAADLSNDEIERHDARFRAIRPLLPSHGTIGFIGRSDAVGEYYVTQFGLAPLRVVRGTQFDHVVSNSSAGPGEGFELERELDGGWTLWKRRAP